MAVFTYPEDRTGVSATNRVSSELHSITYSADADFHFIVPTFAPYFATGFRLIRVASGNRIPLVEGVDYHHALRFMSASTSVGKPVYGGLVLVGIGEDSLYEIEAYQSLGGAHTLDTTAMVELAANITKNPRALTWEQVSSAPQTFNPTDHPWSFADMVGQTEVVQSILSIANSIAARATVANNHHLLKGNVHDVSKYDMDLGEVPNYPPADLPKAVEGASNDTLITPLLMRESLAALGLLELGELSIAMRAHLEDKDAPHEPTAGQIGLGQVVDLPLASIQDITRNLNADKYLTLSGLKMWMSLHGGSLQEKTNAPIKQGALLQHYCTVNYDRMGVYADGKGGTYESIVKVRDTECGYASSVPVAHPQKGEVLDTYCSGPTLMRLVANGSGGVTSTVGEINSPTCTGVNHQPAGTVIGTNCEGTTLVRTVANGAGGTSVERVENSSQCAVNSNPTRGTLTSFNCVGFNMVGTYADGNGGTYEGVLERNSAECGYVKPVIPPTSTFAPQGTVMGLTCAGYNRQEIRANGQGGTYLVTIGANSPDCGYTPTNAPAGTSGPTQAPTQAPDRIGQLTYSNTLSNIYPGDTQVHTVSMTGWTPNKRYTLLEYGFSMAWGNPYERTSVEVPMTTDNNGNATVQFVDAYNPNIPPGRYETWVRERNSGKVSNRFTRVFHASR